MDASVTGQATIVPRYDRGRRIVSFKEDPLGHFEGHYNKRKKNMIVDEKIMEKVEEAENDDRDFNRCIAVEICPRCGNRIRK